MSPSNPSFPPQLTFFYFSALIAKRVAEKKVKAATIKASHKAHI